MPDSPISIRLAFTVHDDVVTSTGFDDRQWLDHMVAVHAEVITDFEREAANAKSSTVRDFANATLPTLRGHVDKLNALRAKRIAETP